MSPRKYNFHNGKSGTALAVRVTPRSKKNEVSQILSDGTIKIKLTAPPVEGKANKALVKYLAELFDVNSSEVEIIAGEKGRNKLVSIYGLDSEIVNQRIKGIVSKK